MKKLIILLLLIGLTGCNPIGSAVPDSIGTTYVYYDIEGRRVGQDAAGGINQ